jgi:two-component system, sporulation sensor kinase B
MREIINNQFNKKIYYIVVLVVLAMMIMGLFINNPRFGEWDIGFIVHCILVFLLSICLLLYARNRADLLRISIIVIAAIYFYMLFFLYPDTWTTFIFLCFIPTLSILFFDSRAFYLSLILNCIVILSIFGYIVFIDQDQLYPYIEQDIMGNLINFVGTQMIIYFIFYLTDSRIKKQKQYYEQIQQAERLKITGQLAAAVAHEIRNPLTVVKGFLQLYEQDPLFKENGKKHFTLMIDELNIAEQVINQFLTIAKPEKDKVYEKVDVNVILQSVTDLLHSYGHFNDNRIELKVIGDCHIVANSIELKQLFINIIKNAIEASNKGDLVLVTAEREDQFVVIKVIDHGRGMSKTEVNSLGTPFYSLKSKGTGLGMMICFNIVEKYKGKIDFETTEGLGTTVTIRFPSL